MSARARFWSMWGLGFCAWGLSLALAAPHDMTLTQRLYDRPGIISNLVYYGGEIPGWLLIAFGLWCLFAGAKRTIGGRPWRPLGWVVLLQALALPLALTQLLKILWGRVRFMHLQAGFSDFTPFYQPAGVGVGKSFPSGHVAMAVLAAVLPFFLWRRGARGPALAAALAVIAWGLFVSYGRMVSGSHYLTDCLFSFGIGWLVAPLVVAGLDRHQAPTSAASNGPPRRSGSACGCGSR